MASAESADPSSVDGAVAAEIAPLLVDIEAASDRHHLSIFSICRSDDRTRNPNEETLFKAAETEESILSRLFLWAWDGSRFSGMICMVLASTIYWIMDVLATTFVAKPIPLFEIVFTRCTVMLILSFIWLRRTGQPTLGPVNTIIILISRALVGYLSLVCFIYSVQNLPLHYAIIVNLASSLVASFAARLLCEEKLSILDIGGLTCSFLAVLLLYHPLFSAHGALMGSGEATTSNKSDNASHINSLFVGMLSSIAGGMSYCLVKSGAKATNQPVLTVLSFGAIACPLSAICGFFFEKIIFLDLYSFIITAILGILAFFAEVFVARGLQLEKTSKAINILYLKVFLTQATSMAFLETTTSFSRLLGCGLLLSSIGSTVYFGLLKEIG